MPATLKERIELVNERIEQACQRAGRSSSEVKLVAVTKMTTVEMAQKALHYGLHSLGENRVQDFIAKYQEIGEDAEWHLIGHLQRNKVKYLVEKVTMIHSLDSLPLARQLDRLSTKQGYPWQVLVQVNVSGEESKYGLSPAELPGFLDAVQDLGGVDVCGLMTIAPYEEDRERVRPVFKQLHHLREEMSQTRPHFDLCHLSMGMTNDFEVAIEEGATLIRVGSALFS